MMLSLNHSGVEKFLRSDFVEIKPGEPSRLVPGKRQASVEQFFCPMCGVENAPPASEVGHCVRCKAIWTCQGNAFYLWTAKSISISDGEETR